MLYIYTETYHEKRFPNRRYWFQWIFIFRHYFHFKYLARARIYVNSVWIDLWMVDVIQILILLHMLSYRNEKVQDFIDSVSLTETFLYHRQFKIIIEILNLTFKKDEFDLNVNNSISLCSEWTGKWQLN